MLVVWWKDDNRTQNELGKSVSKFKTSVTKLVNGLEKRHLIQRVRHPTTMKRFHLLSLTVFLCSGYLGIWAQNTSKMYNLQDILQQTIANNPLLKQAKGKQDLYASKVDLAKQHKYPRLFLEGSFAYIEPYIGC